MDVEFDILGSTKGESNQATADELRDLLVYFSNVAASCSIKLNVGNSESFLKFSGLPLKTRQERVSQFKVYLESIKDAMSLGASPKSSSQTLWSFFRKMKWRPSSDLFSKIEPDDVVEIYGLDSVQIFRNLRFFDFCSYDLVELFLNEWSELFDRNPEVTQKLGLEALEVIKSANPSTVPISVGWHMMQEKFSKLKVKMNIRNKWLSPVFDQGTGQVIAFVAISEANIEN